MQPRTATGQGAVHIRKDAHPFSVAAAVAATLAACSSQSGKGSGSAAGGITLWTHNGGNKEELDVVNSAVKDFNAANPDTQVTVKSFPQESYNDAIASAAVSGNLPDILDLDGPIMPSWEISAKAAVAIALRVSAATRTRLRPSDCDRRPHI